MRTDVVDWVYNQFPVSSLWREEIGELVDW